MSKRTSLLAAIAATSLLVATPALASESQPSPSDAGTTASYIVQFTPGSDRATEVARAKALGMSVTYEYTTAIKGMAVLANAGQLRALQANPNVQLVEADGIATISATQSPVTWGLDRIDQRNLPLSSSYTYSHNGAGVRAYVIDTGIEAGHLEFAGRMAPGYDAVTTGGTADDCNGHGTHVAGTIGGTTYGVAKGVTLVPVRVLGCSGSGAWSGVIAGVDWVADDANGRPAVANMSLGGGYFTSLNTAVTNAVAAGVTFAVAGGNNGADACNYSPASTDLAITVGATASNDARASYSNYGTCLDIFAPGSGITSAWHTSTTATNTISGTSMASPHVAGAAVLYLATNPGASPSTVASALTTNATASKVTSAGTGSPNRLLFVDGGSTTPPPPPPPSDVVPSAPTNLSTSNVTQTSATLNWSAPTTTGISEITYSVRWGKAGPKGTVSWSPGWVPASGTAHPLTALSSRTKYVWEVRAENEAGIGPAASASFTTKRA